MMSRINLVCLSITVGFAAWIVLAGGDAHAGEKHSREESAPTEERPAKRARTESYQAESHDPVEIHDLIQSTKPVYRKSVFFDSVSRTLGESLNSVTFPVGKPITPEGAEWAMDFGNRICVRFGFDSLANASLKIEGSDEKWQLVCGVGAAGVVGAGAVVATEYAVLGGLCALVKLAGGLGTVASGPPGWLAAGLGLIAAGATYHSYHHDQPHSWFSQLECVGSPNRLNSMTDWDVRVAVEEIQHYGQQRVE